MCVLVGGEERILAMVKPQEMTLEELVMVKNYIIYLVIVDLLQRDIGKIKKADKYLWFISEVYRMFKKL
jgi:hypothetical protein